MSDAPYGMRVHENSLANAMQLIFPGVVPRAVTDELRKLGFRWTKGAKRWTLTPLDDRSRSVAQSAANRLAAIQADYERRQALKNG